MERKIKRFLAITWSVLILGSSSVDAAGCDRSCLEGLMSDYIGALGAHNPTGLPITPDVKYVENNQIIPIGTGEWLVASSPGKYNHVFADPESGQVAAITTIKENGVPVIYIVRLKVEDDGSINEIETQITRDEEGAGRYEEMGEPEDVWLTGVPPEDRIPRQVLISQTDRYYSGMEGNDPNGDYSFFDEECNRLEDGLQTTNMDNGDPYGHSNDTAFASLGCEEQFQTGFLGFVTKIRERRYPVVDEERQAVFAITTFDHNATVRSLPSVNGTSSPIPPYFDVPRTLQAAEAFRLRGDKLFRIEMTLTEVPYGMRPAFKGDPPVDLTGPGTSVSTDIPCDRACLHDVVYQVLKAMVAHDASKLPLAEGVRYSENGQFLALNDGLWQTLSEIAMPGVDDYAARFTDPEAGTAAYWGLSKEQDIPGVLALRVKVEEGKITEIEAIDVRAEFSDERGGTLTLMRPPLPVEWDGSSLGRLDPVFQQNMTGNTSIPSGLITAYFDGLERHDSPDVPFATGCIRRDNGFRGNVSCAAQMNGSGIAPNGLYNLTKTVRDRRVLVQDAYRGVVLAVAMVDNPAIREGPRALAETELVPSTYMVPQLIKVDKGSISRIEGMVKWMPLGYTSAWSEGE